MQEVVMESILKESRFDFLSAADKDFILAYDREMNRLGYDFGGKIGDGYCWGRYMILYRKSGAKSDKVYARVYLRDSGPALRLFLNGIDAHRDYIENAPDFIQEVFVGPAGDCQRCHNDKGGACRFRKTYTLHQRTIDKCNGITFEFREPDLLKLKDYIALFTEFYPLAERRPKVQAVA
jgi:hypothetical protein